MTREEAIRLIRSPAPLDAEPGVWADLGAGSGTFTLALAQLLAWGSSIYAVDQNARSLKGIPPADGITIEKIQGDFTSTALLPEKMNGILMANALHFVEDKLGFLKKVSPHLLPSGIFLIVEYDLQKPNHWVPYPLPFTTLQKLFEDRLGRSVQKLGEMASRYNRSMIYGALVS